MRLHRLFLACAIGNLLAFIATAQIPDSLQRWVDSLKVELRSDDVTDVYEAEFGIAYELFDVDNMIAIEYGCRAYSTALEIGDTAKIVRSGRLCAQLLRRVDRADSALLIFSQVLPLAELLGDSVELGKVLNAMAVLFNYQGRFDQAMAYNLRALRLRKALKDTANIIVSLENTAIIYYTLENSVEAERFYDEALKYLNGRANVMLLINRSLNRLALNDFSGFRRLSSEALRNASEYDLASVHMHYNFGFGWYYTKQRKYDSARIFYSMSLQEAQRQGNTRIAAESRLGIAEGCLRTAKNDLGLNVLKGLDGELNGGRYDPLLKRYYDYMSTLLEKKGNLAEALCFRNLHLTLSDSIYSRKMANNVMMAKVRFEEEQNEVTIAHQELVIGLKEQMISRQRYLLVVSVFLLAVVLTLTLVLYRFHKYQQQISRDLDRKVFDRTRELEESEKALVSALGEQNALMEVISTKVLSTIATFRGLWIVRGYESSVSTNEEFERAASDLLQVRKIIKTAERTSLIRY